MKFIHLLKLLFIYLQSIGGHFDQEHHKCKKMEGWGDTKKEKK